MSEIIIIVAGFVAFTLVWAFLTAKAIKRAEPEFKELELRINEFKKALLDAFENVINWFLREAEKRGRKK